VADYTPIQYGDVLFAGSGETIEEIGKSAVNLLDEPACCGGDVVIFRPTFQTDAKFLGLATDCPQAAYQKSCMGRGITVMHIYGDELKYLFVTLPPLPEQAAIVDYLDQATANIDTAITRAEREIELLNEYRTRLIADVVTGKLDVRDAAAALPEVDPLTEPDDADDLDSYIDMDADELDAIPEEVEA
jgi:type I restriction enzyme S subunit